MTQLVKLQGINDKLPGTPVKDMRIGDVIVWNYGYKSEVMDMVPSETGKTFTVTLKSLESGSVSSRRMGVTRLVVIEKKPEAESTHKVAEAIKRRKVTHYGIYSDVGRVLEEFSIEELVDYYVNVLDSENLLRYYLEQQIIANEIAKEREKK